jgi:predicted RNase H-like nuclease
MGVDGCKDGWVVAQAEGDLSQVWFRRADTISDVFADLDGDFIAAIYMPIGLPTDKARACDLEARRLLSPHGSRVFPAPSRAASATTDYRKCCDLNKEALRTGLTKQSFALLPKICEVDQYMTPDKQDYIREAHPEVTFRILADEALEFPKKTVAGNIERIELLRRLGIVIDLTAESSLAMLAAALDDVLDAAACLLTARRISLAQAKVLSDGARDARRLRMEMVA